MTPLRIGVVGGGIAGLATATLLARDGHDVTVWEKRDVVGGRAGTWTMSGFRFDTGPSWFLMPGVFEHFFRLAGSSTEAELALTRLDPAYRVVFENQPTIDVRSGRKEVRALFRSLEPGADHELDRYLDSAAETYRMAVDRFLYTSFESARPFLDPVLLRRAPRLIVLIAQPLERFIARRFRDPRLRQLLGYPAVFLGAAPSIAPAMFHLMSHLDLDDGVYYPKGGFSVLIDRIAALAKDAGVRVVTGAEVTAVTVERTGKRRARVTGVTVDSAEGSEHHAADIVVGAADLHHVETRLVPREFQTYPQRYWDKRLAGPGALLLYLGVQGRLPELEHHTLVFAEDWKQNFGDIFGPRRRVPHPASLYVSRTSATDGDAAPAEHENLFVLVPIPADTALGTGGIDGSGSAAAEQLADEVIAQIASWCGIPDLADRIVVRRIVTPADFIADLNAWQGTALGPAHTRTQSAFWRTGNASRRVDGLLYAGSSTIPGIGLPMCLISAELIVKRLRGDTSAGPLPEPITEDRGEPESLGRDS